MPGTPTGNPPPTSNVSNPPRPAASRANSARPRRTASRHASTAPSCEPTCRCTPRIAIGPSSGVPATAAVSSVSVMPNLLASWPTASPAWVSGVTAGLSRSSTSSRGSRPRPRPARSARAARSSSSSALSSATQRRGSPSTTAPTAARRSAWLLPIPSSVIRAFGSPARRADAHSPRETTFASRPSAPRRPTIAGTSFALSEYARSHGSGNAARSSSAAPSSAAIEVTPTGVPKRAAAARSRSGGAGIGEVAEPSSGPGAPTVSP